MRIRINLKKRNRRRMKSKKINQKFLDSKRYQDNRKFQNKKSKKLNLKLNKSTSILIK